MAAAARRHPPTYGALPTTPTGSQSPLLHMATVELFFHQLVLRRRSSYAASCHWKMPTAIDDMMGVEWQSKWEYAAEITPR